MVRLPHPHQGYLPIFSTRDRRKLTFYFIAEKRIDFRELVRELFRFVPLLDIYFLICSHLDQPIQNSYLDGDGDTQGIHRLRAIW